MVRVPSISALKLSKSSGVDPSVWERQSQKAVSPQEEWINYHRSGLALQPKSEVIRYARVFRPQTAR
jgi:hypothetical protein